jgi:hypothetical protein
MKIGLLAVMGLILASCNDMKTIDGVPEIILRDDYGYAVSVQADGGRLITINRGETIVSVILLQPQKSTNKNQIDLEKK